MTLPHEPTRSDPNADAHATHSAGDDLAATTGGPADGSVASTPPVPATRYVLGAEIARGGMGVVYRATDTAFGREVAVKVLLDQYAPTSGTARRFHDEARITGQLQHPNIPAVFDLGTLPDGRPFLAMKLIKGDTLEELLRQRPDPTHDRGRFVAVFEQVCQAMGYAHSRNVIHRDLKPSNVMVGNFGEVQVMDWGLAKVLGLRTEEPSDADETKAGTAIISLRDSDDVMTRAGSVLGTPAYMPPEQAVGAVETVDARSDVFGLGAVLAVILTGQTPYVSGSSESTRVLAARGDVVECFGRLDGCGAEPGLVALCKRCLAPRPEERPSDAGEVARAVAGLRTAADERARQAELDRVKVEGEKAAAEVRAAEQRKRRRVWAALAGLAAVLLAGVGGVWVWRVREADSRKAEEQVRAARASDAQAALLDQAEYWLGEGDAARAGLFLAQAEERAGEAGDTLTERLARDRNGLAILRELDAVDAFKWTPVESKPPERKVVADRWAAVFEGFGIVPGTTPPVEAADRIRSSPSRVPLLAALDSWLAYGGGEQVRLILAAADPDPFRDGVRRGVAAQDRPGLAALVERQEWTAQPAGLLVAFASSPEISPEDRHRLLTRLAIARPSDFGVLMELGNNARYRTPEDLDEQLGWYQAAVAARPTNPIAHYDRGFVLSRKMDSDGAIAEYREAIRLDPKYSRARIGLGNSLMNKGDLDGAEAEYREAIRLDPQDGVLLVLLADALERKGDKDGALVEYRKAVRLSPNYAYARLRLCTALRARGDRAGADAEHSEHLRLNPKDFGARYWLALELKGKGELEGTIAEFREAIRLNPKSAVIHHLLGEILTAKGDRDGAIAEYKEAIRLDPKNARAHSNLAAVLRDKGDLDGAVAEYRTALRFDPRNARACFNLGYVLRTRGDLDGAAAEYREAIRLDPKYAQAHHYLAIILRDKGDLAGAEREHREAIRLDPKDTYFHGNLAWVLEQKGDFDGALGEYTEALRLDPKQNYAVAGLSRLERMRALLSRLPKVLAGDDRPATATEALGFGELCMQPFQRRFAASVRFYEQAFALDPALAESIALDHRYNAACCAARSASGDGVDSPADSKDRAVLRGKALAWLRADLAVRKKQAASSSGAERKGADAALTHWLVDTDLTETLPGAKRDGWTSEEVKAWDQLWADVKATLAEARKPPPPPELAPPPRPK